MTVTLRFRPVTFGSPGKPTVVFYLEETPDGVIFRDMEISWPLKVALEEAEVGDLPKLYQGKELAARILPVQEVAGETLYEASKRMDEVLEGLYARRARSTPRKQQTPARQRRGAA
ncbi:MAG: hypothetical protein HY690_09015 [Chloroflexi bacterium]|nr:hypothetical protein [Chloroflexota bacterium]